MNSAALMSCICPTSLSFYEGRMHLLWCNFRTMGVGPRGVFNAEQWRPNCMVMELQCLHFAECIINAAPTAVAMDRAKNRALTPGCRCPATTACS
jgi:hypothetical protein